MWFGLWNRNRTDVVSNKGTSSLSKHAKYSKIQNSRTYTVIYFGPFLTVLYWTPTRLL